MSFRRFFLVRLGWALFGVWLAVTVVRVWLSYGISFSVAEAAILYAAFVAIAVHFLVDVAVGALDSDLRAEWPVAGMPART